MYEINCSQKKAKLTSNKKWKTHKINTVVEFAYHFWLFCSVYEYKDIHHPNIRIVAPPSWKIEIFQNYTRKGQLFGCFSYLLICSCFVFSFLFFFHLLLLFFTDYFLFFLGGGLDIIVRYTLLFCCETNAIRLLVLIMNLVIVKLVIVNVVPLVATQMQLVQLTNLMLLFVLVTKASRVME